MGRVGHAPNMLAVKIRNKEIGKRETEGKRSSFALLHESHSQSDPLFASTYQCSKILNSPAEGADWKTHFCTMVRNASPCHRSRILCILWPISWLTRRAFEAQRGKGAYPRSHSWWVAVRTRARISKLKSKIYPLGQVLRKGNCGTGTWPTGSRTGPLRGGGPGKWCSE